jgi:hypothetical protein
MSKIYESDSINRLWIEQAIEPCEYAPNGIQNLLLMIQMVCYDRARNASDENNSMYWNKIADLLNEAIYEAEC